MVVLNCIMAFLKMYVPTNNLVVHTNLLRLYDFLTSYKLKSDENLEFCIYIDPFK